MPCGRRLSCSSFRRCSDTSDRVVLHPFSTAAFADDRQLWNHTFATSAQGDSNEEVAEAHRRCSRDGPDLGNRMSSHWCADRAAHRSEWALVDAWPTALAIPGFLGGAVFSAVLRIAEGRRRFDELSLPRFGAWGAVTGLLLGVLAVSAGVASAIFSGCGCGLP